MSNWKDSVYILLIIVTSLGFFTTQKHWALGVALYFIPSDSMAPTLLPKDVLLVDTWRYHYDSPVYGDVVVFRSDQQNRVLVKRIAGWPDGQVWNNDKLYVIGDNSKNSTDSRAFGGVLVNQIIGEGRYVLVSLQNDRRYRALKKIAEN